MKSGVKKFSRRLKEVDDYVTIDREAWTTIAVPKTVALPVVQGEPAV